MEATHPTTHALDADLGDLQELLSRPGPVLTAVLQTDGDVEQASNLAQARWSAQRQEAEALGVPASALEAIDGAVPGAHGRGPWLFVVAGEDGLRWREPLAVGGPLLRWSSLPSLLPAIDDRQRRLPVLLARCDRRGADLSILEPLSAQELASVQDVDPHEQKVQAGGWSHRRFHQRAENSLEGTAEEIAGAIEAALPRLGAAGVTVLVGDDRTVDSVADRLPADLDVRRAPGGRGRDGSDDEVAHEVERIRDTVAAERTTAAMRELRERLARDQAVEGADAVLLALAEGRVQRLLVSPRDDGRTARFDPSTGFPVLDDGSVSDTAPVEAALVDVAVRAALATSASVRMLPSAGGPADGLGAIVRWDEPS